jgi:hypothetical protein
MCGTLAALLLIIGLGYARACFKFNRDPLSRKAVLAIFSSAEAFSFAAGPEDTWPAKRKLHMQYRGYAFNVALVFYPFVSRAVVAVFSCRVVDGISYLQADYRVICHNGAWYLAVAGSVVICIVFVFGLPAYCATSVIRGDSAVGFLAAGGDHSLALAAPRSRSHTAVLQATKRIRVCLCSVGRYLDQRCAILIPADWRCIMHIGPRDGPEGDPDIGLCFLERRNCDAGDPVAVLNAKPYTMLTSSLGVFRGSWRSLFSYPRLSCVCTWW